MVDPYKNHGTLYSPPDSGKGPAIFVGTLSVLLVYGVIIYAALKVLSWLL